MQNDFFFLGFSSLGIVVFFIKRKNWQEEILSGNQKLVFSYNKFEKFDMQFVILVLF